MQHEKVQQGNSATLNEWMQHERSLIQKTAAWKSVTRKSEIWKNCAKVH